MCAVCLSQQLTCTNKIQTIRKEYNIVTVVNMCVWIIARIQTHEALPPTKKTTAQTHIVVSIRQSCVEVVQPTARYRKGDKPTRTQLFSFKFPECLRFYQWTQKRRHGPSGRVIRSPMPVFYRDFSFGWYSDFVFTDEKFRFSDETQRNMLSDCFRFPYVRLYLVYSLRVICFGAFFLYQSSSNLDRRRVAFCSQINRVLLSQRIEWCDGILLCCVR